MCTCYTLKRQDEEYFGGLREAVLDRDGYRCRIYDASGRDKRSIHRASPCSWTVRSEPDAFVVSGLPREASPHQGRSFGDARHFYWSYGEDSIQMAMSKSSSTSPARSQLLSPFACFERTSRPVRSVRAGSFL